MVEDKKTGTSSSSLNGKSDLEGKLIIDSTGNVVGKCKGVCINDDGQIGLIFEVEINEKKIVPSRTIPYNTIGKITDIVELKVPLNIKIAQSTEELKQLTNEKNDSMREEKLEKLEVIHEETALAIEEKSEIRENGEDLQDRKVNDEEVKDEHQIDSIQLTKTTQANAADELIKALDVKESMKTIDEKQIMREKFTVPVIIDLMMGLDESIAKLESLFTLLSKGKDTEKIETAKALTSLVNISPGLGLSLIPKMLKLSDYPQQDVRLAIAQQLEVISECNPELFINYFFEILENVYDEPINEIREYLIKTLHNIALKIPDVVSEEFEGFLEDVIFGKRVPEVPSKVIHEATLKVVSGNFHLTRIAIKVRLKTIAKGGKLASRTIEELQDYNATLIGLTLIEAFNLQEAEKLVNNITFKKLGSIFIEVINQMLEAYKEGSLDLLAKVVDKKIEIPINVIERFFEIKISKTLEGVKSAPIDVFLESTYISPDVAEQIIYRLVVKKRLNALITVNNGRTFLTANVAEEPKRKPKSPAKKTVQKTS